MYEIVYKLSDLVAKNKMPSFRVFKDKVLVNHRYWMTLRTLHKLHAFIEVIQYHPRKSELSFALRTVFKMVLDEMYDDPCYIGLLITSYPRIHRMRPGVSFTKKKKKGIKRRIRW